MLALNVHNRMSNKIVIRLSDLAVVSLVQIEGLHDDYECEIS